MLEFSDLFDNSFYLAENPDVATAVARGAFNSGLDHFIQFGKFEQRDPSIFFDSKLYLTLNPDVAIRVAGNQGTAFDHFIAFGQFEKRDPTFLFNTSFYQEKNTDVAAAVERDEITEYQHFVEFGQFEGRALNPFFNEAFYLGRNPDVAAAVERDKITGFAHFAHFGQFEGRDPSALLNTNFYLTQNPDVANAIALGQIPSAIAHLLLFGLAENRLTTPPETQNAIATAVDLGILTGTRQFNELISNNNPTDIYRFSLGVKSNLNLALNGLSADVDLELIEDLDSNGEIESEDIIESSAQLGTQAESIQFESLPGGTYFVRVSQFEGETNYSLSLSATPVDENDEFVIASLNRLSSP